MAHAMSKSDWAILFEDVLRAGDEVNLQLLPGWDVIEGKLLQNLKSIVSLLEVIEPICTAGRLLYNAYSWEIIEFIFSVSASTELMPTQEELGHLLCLLAASASVVRAREWTLMLLERLNGDVERIDTFVLACFAVQLSEAQNELPSKSELLHKGLPLILAKAFQLFDASDNNESVLLNVIDVSLTFFTGTISRAKTWQLRSSHESHCTPFDKQSTELLLNFMEHCLGRFVSAIGSIDERKRRLDSAAQATLLLFTAHSTEEIGFLWDRIAEKKRSMFSAFRRQARDKCSRLTIDNDKLMNSINMIKTIDDKDERKEVNDYVSHILEEEGQQTSYMNESTALVTGSLLAFRERAKLVFAQGNATGCALLVYALGLPLLAFQDESSAAFPNSMVGVDVNDVQVDCEQATAQMPMVFDPALLQAVVMDAMEQLVLCKELSHEGVIAFASLFVTAGTTADFKHTSLSTQQHFVAQWAQLECDELLDDYAKCFFAQFSSLDLKSQQLMQRKCMIAASSAHIWAMFQCVTSALVTISSDDQRTRTVNALKSWLRGLDSISAFTLLSHAIRECPYPILKATLIDIARVFMQADALAKSSLSASADCSEVDWSLVLSTANSEVKCNPAAILEGFETSHASVICGRILDDRQIERSWLLTVCAGQDLTADITSKMGFSPLNVKRFALNELVAMSKKWNSAESSISSEDITTLNASVNLLGFVVSRLFHDRWQSTYWTVTQVTVPVFKALRDLADCGGLLHSLAVRVKEIETTHSYPLQSSVDLDALHRDLLLSNIVHCQSKIADLLCILQSTQSLV